MEEMVPRARPRLLALLVVLGLTVAAGPAAGLGTDPFLAQQWGLRQIGAPAAWSGGALIGDGVPIAVIDTGVDLGHEDLRDRISGAVTCVDTGGDPGRCRADGADIEGHGSHVAGIAAASANDVGISGVAPGARIVAVRVFTESESSLTGAKSYGASSDDINAGIRWVLRNVGRKGVINLSLGGNFIVTSAFGTSFADGINEAWSAGWLPVLASGNENMLGVESSNYGRLPAMVVGATGPDDEVAPYSSETGDAQWAILAPGGDGRSSDPERSGCEVQPARCVLSTYKEGYGYLQGTSMAAPHVAGAAALVMGAGRSNAETVQRLLDTANPAVECGGRCRGRLDVAKAVAGLAPASGGGAPAPASGSSGSAAPPPPSPTTAGPVRPAATTGAPRPPTTGAPFAPAPVPPMSVEETVSAAPETSAPTSAAAEEAVSMPAEAGTDLSTDDAAAITVDPPADPRRPSAGIVAAAAVAALGVTMWASLIVWRRRRAGGPLLG